eukprot:s455_g16.t1
MPNFASHVRSGRSKLCLVACLVLSSAVLLIDAKEKVQRAQSAKSGQSAQSAKSGQRGWDVGEAKCCVGKVLRAPDTLILQSLNRIAEYVKLKLFLRPSQVSAKENAWLNSAKDEICARFGISPVPELLICDDSRMLAQAGPHGCRGFGKGWVVLSKGVLETLPPQEVVAVLAHELTHVAKNHHLKRGFLILDFYRLMLLWSLKQKEDSALLDLQTTVATVTMWLLLGLRSRSQEMEADRHMLLVGLGSSTERFGTERFGSGASVSQPGIFTRSASAILSGGGVIAASTDVDAPRERSDPLLTRHQSRRQAGLLQPHRVYPRN